MKIENINPSLSFCAKNSYNGAHKVHEKRQHTAMQDGLTTAGEWFGFGIGFDLLSRKLQFSKSPIKNSLALNSLLGTGAGIYTGMQCRKKQSESYK